MRRRPDDAQRRERLVGVHHALLDRKHRTGHQRGWVVAWLGSENSLIHVTALTSGRSTPSARFRIRQHIVRLRGFGIDVEEHSPAVSQHARFPGFLGRARLRYMAPLAVAQGLFNLALRLPGVVASHRGQVTWIERNFVPGLDGFAVLAKAPRVLDVDDAIWLGHPLWAATVSRLAQKCRCVIAGNRFIAEWFSQHCADVRIVPTAIDCGRFTPRGYQGSDDNGPLVVGWTGTSSNFRFLNIIEPALARFLASHPRARLRIVADSPPELPGLPAERVEFIQWRPNIEAEAIQAFDIGLMPLADDDWSRGKCSFKMLQYMATGLPVVVSPVGMNAEVLAQGESGLQARSADDWVDALQMLAGDPALRARMGGVGRRVVEAHFDTSVVAGQLARIFRDVAST